MKAIATKQPTNESVKQNKSGEKGRSRSVSPLSTEMPLLQRQCACGGGCPRCQEKLGIQTKLKISEPGDQYEQEADRIADAIMHLPAPSVQRQMEQEEEEEEKERVQKKSIANPITPLIQRQALLEMEEEEEEDLMQRKESNNPAPIQDSAIVHEALHSTGQPLDRETRTFMESRFGYNFSQVRVHTNSQATAAAAAVNAKAYTVKQDIVFGSGWYTPTSYDGKHLIAHELTHVMQQTTPGRTHKTQEQPYIQRTPLKEELEQELEAWATKEGKSIDPSDRYFAFNLQEFAWTLISDPATLGPIPKPKEKKDLEVWQKKFQKAQLLAAMILAGGEAVEQKEDQAAFILNLMAQAGFSAETMALAKTMTGASQIEFVYQGMLSRVQDVDAESLTTITEFFIAQKGTSDNPIIDKLTDSSGSFEQTLSNSQMTAILKPLIKTYEADPIMIQVLPEVLIHKPKYRAIFSKWMWEEKKGEFLFKILESPYFIEPEYGPTKFPEVGELNLKKDMPWVYLNKQKYYVQYLEQLGQDTGVDIKAPENFKFATIRKWLDDHTEKIGEALAKKYPTDPDRWIKVYEQITDIFTYHVSGRKVRPDLKGKLGKLRPGAPENLRLKVDCDVLATYAMRYFFSIQDPTNPNLKPFEPIGYMAIAPEGSEGHAVALMRREGKYYVVSNKQVFATTVVDTVKDDDKKKDGLRAAKQEALDIYKSQPKSYKVYYADALVGGAMSKAFAEIEESTRRQDLEPP
jgi:hypothetical protein